jgi:hypothetical protein
MMFDIIRSLCHILETEPINRMMSISPEIRGLIRNLFPFKY